MFRLRRRKREKVWEITRGRGDGFCVFFPSLASGGKTAGSDKSIFFRTLVLDKSAAALKRRRENAGSRS